MNDVIPMLDHLPLDLTWSEKIALLTVGVLDLPQHEVPLAHHFEDDGTYIREITCPAGAIIIGRTHIHGHLCELLEGEVIHVTEGARIHRKAPFSVHTTPGYQMVVYTMTPIKARTVHPNPTDSRDVDELENSIFEPADKVKALGESIRKRLT